MGVEVIARLRNWWLVCRAEGEMLALNAHQNVADRVEIARSIRQLLRNAGWDDERIDPWMAERSK
jgi:squalene cyclase